MRLPTPLPALGLEAMDRERTEAFRLNPRKEDNFHRWVRFRSELSSGIVPKVDFLPIRMDIELVSRCNFRCPMCAVAAWKKGRRAEDMDIGQFKRLLDQQHGLVEVKLTGIGEPLLQGDDLFEAIRYARAKRIWTRMVTNASLLHLRNNIRKLVDSDLCDLHVSFDGADAETFEMIRPGAVFNHILKSCEALNKAWPDQPRTQAWCVVQKGNREQMSDIVRLTAKLGFPAVTFSLSMHGWGRDDLAERNKGEEDRPSENELLDLVDFGNVVGIRVAFWDVGNKFSAHHPEFLCPWPFERSFVSSDMRAVPCCMIGDPDAFEIGKGIGSSFETTWFSDEYEAFRNAHASGAVPKVCRGCYKCA